MKHVTERNSQLDYMFKSSYYESPKNMIPDWRQLGKITIKWQ
jgi:hypothetical protein